MYILQFYQRSSRIYTRQYNVWQSGDVANSKFLLPDNTHAATTLYLLFFIYLLKNIADKATDGLTDCAVAYTYSVVATFVASPLIKQLIMLHIYGNPCSKYLFNTLFDCMNVPFSRNMYQIDHRGIIRNLTLESMHCCNVYI